MPQVAVAAFWAASSVRALHTRRLVVAAAVSILAGISKETGDYLKVLGNSDSNGITSIGGLVRMKIYGC